MDQNKNLLSSNYMLDMHPCSATDHRSESDLSWKLEVVFCTKLEKMFKQTAPDPDIAKTDM